MITAADLAIVDQRIRATREIDRAVGTVATVNGAALRATVTFDGSALAVPAKMLGGVHAATGDRVTLHRYGSDWVITGTFAVRFPDSQGVNAQAPVATTSSGTFANYPGSPSFTFTKRWDVTRVRVEAHCQMYSTINTTTVVVGVRFTDTATAAVDEFHVVRWYWSEAFVHTSFSGVLHIPASGLPAATYTVEPLWARWSGTGVISTNTDDWYSFAAVEVGP